MCLIKSKKITKVIKIGNVKIGGLEPIRVQSMCNIKTEYFEKVISQINNLVEAGCELIRVSVKDDEDINGLKKIVKTVDIPVIADIHFDYKLALKSIDAGVKKLRINPGNITEEWKIKEIVCASKNVGIPIRIGVNLGSLEKELVKELEEKRISASEAVVKSAIKEVECLEKYDFENIVVSLKTSDVLDTIKSYKKFSELRDYPLHVGITETGTLRGGLIKSGIGIGCILMQGIGNTIRVSLSADPIEEIYAGYNILNTLKLRKDLPDFVSCPTCGRTEIDLIGIAEKVEKMLYTIKKPIKVAVMGCVVNGPGEARDADIGITGGKGVGILFKKGKVIKKVKESEILEVLKEELEKYR